MVTVKILKNLVIAGMAFLWMSCAQKDEEKIVGKWSNDDNWFDYKADNTYNSGIGEIKMTNDYKYSLDATKKELTMYTNNKDKTFYLTYEFIGDDTLAVRNVMSSDKTMIKFVKEKKKN